MASFSIAYVKYVSETIASIFDETLTKFRFDKPKRLMAEPKQQEIRLIIVN